MRRLRRVDGSRSTVVRSLPQPLDVLSLHPHTLDDVSDDIRRVGKATDTDTLAAELVAELRERIDTVQRITARISERPLVACIEWYEPLYTGGHWIPQMVDIAGAVSTLSAVGKPSVRVGWETVIAGRPDVIDSLGLCTRSYFRHRRIRPV